MPPDVATAALYLKENELLPNDWRNTDPIIAQAATNVRCRLQGKAQRREKGENRAIDFAPSKWLNVCVTATLEQIQSELLSLIELAQRGEEVVITRQGQAIAKLTGVAQPRAAANRQVWRAKLARLRESTATGKTIPTTEQILEDLRAERG